MIKLLLPLLTILALAPSALAGEIEMQAIVYPPLVFETDGELRGAATEIVEAIQKRVGDTNTLQTAPWLRAYSQTKAGGSKALFAIVRIPEREDHFKWVGPVFGEGDYFFKRKADTITIKDLEDARSAPRIAVRKDGYTHQTLAAKGFENLDISPNYNSSYKKLATGRVNLVLMGERTYYYMLKSAGLDPSKFERTDFKFAESSAWLAFSRDIPDDTIAKWQKALNELKANGTYDAIMRRNFHN